MFSSSTYSSPSMDALYTRPQSCGKLASVNVPFENPSSDTCALRSPMHTPWQYARTRYTRRGP